MRTKKVAKNTKRKDSRRSSDSGKRLEEKLAKMGGKALDHWPKDAQELNAKLSQMVSERKQIEESLRQSEAKFRILADNTYDMEFWINPEGHYLFVSPSCKTITGHDPSEFSENPRLRRNLVHPEDLPIFDGHLREEQEEVTPREVQFRIIRPDSSTRWIGHVCERMFDAEGHFLGIRGSNRDITDRKQMEEALRESEGRYRMLVDTAPDAVVVHRDNRFLYANSAALQLYGVATFEQLTAHSISDLLHPDEREPVAERSQLVMNGEKTPLRETRVLRLDGRYVPVEVTAAPIIYQGGKAVQAIIRDITLRKKAEEALEAARVEVLNEKNRLEAVMEALPVGVVITDAKGGIIRFNQAYDAVWSKPRPTALSIGDYTSYRAWWSETGKPVAPEEWASAQAIQKGQAVVGQLLEIQRFDGSRTSVINSGAPICDADGRIAGCAVAIQDITDLRKAEEALRKNKERFELLSETASKLLATDKPQEVVNELCQKVMAYLDCHAFFNYLVDEEKGCLHLNAYAGIPEKAGQEIEWLDYGVAVCGCAARDASRIVAEDIPNTPDPRTDLVKSFGIKAYACHPLFSAGRVIGTLSFGTRSRTTFTEEELSLMKTVADQVAVAMERIRLIEALRRSRDELEMRVKQRTFELARANELLERVFSSIDIMIAYMDKDFNFIRVNRAYAAADEREPDFYVGKNHFALFPNEENEQIFRKIVETGEPYSVYAKPFEYAEHPERGVTHWDWSLQPVKEPDGSMGGVVLSLVNVTERIRAQEAVAAERQRFNDVLEILPAYLVLLSPDYHVPFANRFFRERFGESHGQRCFEFLFGRSKPCETCESYVPLKTMAPHQWEWTGPDGGVYDVFDFPFTDTDGTTLILEMGIDITERKRAEEAVRVASLYTRSLIEASLDPLVTISGDGKIMDVNSATELTTGVPRDELIGTDFSDYFTEPEKAREGYQRVFQVGFVRDYPLAIRHTSGKVTDVLYHATVFRNEVGETQGVFAAARDITARKRAEEALRESENRLRVLSSQLINVQEAERKRIAREIHDSIGQTLAAIKFALESKLSQMGGGAAPPGVSIENIISLTQSGIEESRRIQMDLRPSILDDLGILATIGWFTREFQKVYSHVSVEKQISVEEGEIPDSLRTVLFRVMQEAMNNVTKHSKANLIRLVLKMTTDKIELSIEDNGTGFDPENTKQGLGLTSMRERTELSGGTFEVESTPGRGTTIRAKWTV